MGKRSSDIHMVKHGVLNEPISLLISWARRRHILLPQSQDRRILYDSRNLFLRGSCPETLWSFSKFVRYQDSFLPLFVVVWEKRSRKEHMLWLNNRFLFS